MMTEITIRKPMIYNCVGTYNHNKNNYNNDGNQDDNNDDMDRWAVIKLAARASSAVVATSATEVEPSCEKALSQ